MYENITLALADLPVGKSLDLCSFAQKITMQIGITGHRRIPAGDVARLEEAVKAFFAAQEAVLRGEMPVLLSSLAEGADMLCARLALERGWRLVVPLPLSAEVYREDFADRVAEDFDALLSAASEVFVVPPIEPIPSAPSRGFCYRQAGLYVARHADLLLALWDGVEKTTPDGAGTAETVRLARQFGTPVLCIPIVYPLVPLDQD